MESGPINTDLTDQLTKLSKLHADGVLSDEEFKALKAKLISGINLNPNEKGKSFSTAPSLDTPALLKSIQQPLWKRIIVGGAYVFVCGLILLMVFSIGRQISGSFNVGTPDLKVTSNGTAMSITNVGSGSVEIMDISVNERNDCTMEKAYGGFTERPLLFGNNNAPIAIESWGIPESLAYLSDTDRQKMNFVPFEIKDTANIEEYLSNEDRHKRWVTGKYQFAVNPAGKYHANICLHPEQKRAAGLLPVPMVAFGFCDPISPFCWVCERKDIRRISLDPTFGKIVLNVGQSMTRNITCDAQIISATVVTDHGSGQYSWK